MGVRNQSGCASGTGEAGRATSGRRPTGVGCRVMGYAGRAGPARRAGNDVTTGSRQRFTTEGTEDTEKKGREEDSPGDRRVGLRAWGVDAWGPALSSLSLSFFSVLSVS